MAYNGLYEIYVGNQPMTARSTALKMLALSPDLAEGHAAIAYLDFMDWRWPAAELHFQQSIRLNPKCAIAHMRYGFCLVHAGRVEEGRRELLAAQALDPISPRIKKNLGHVFYVRREFTNAIAQYQEALKIEPSYPAAHLFIGKALEEIGDFTNSTLEVEGTYRDTRPISKRMRERCADLRRSYAEGGTESYWKTQLSHSIQDGSLNGQSCAWAKLNDYPRALDLLERYFQTNEYESLERLYFDPCWDTVHEDPRFVGLLKRTGLRQ